MFGFAFPYIFIVLVYIPIMFWYRRRMRMRPVMRVSDTRGLENIPPSMALRADRFLLPLKIFVLILMIMAMARPQWGTRRTSIQTEGINIILAVDMSESMAALDFKRKGQIINRLEAAKGVIHDFIVKRKGDRIGMVVFGTNAFTQLPLTRDYNTISYILDRLKIGAAGPNTAIGDAIGIGLKRIADIESKSNVIILLTDGQSNSGQLKPEVAAGVAADMGVKIYTIGIGSRGKAPFLVKDPFFGERYIYQRVDIDETTLRRIAEETGGLYFRAEDTDGLKKIYDTIDDLEKTKVKMKTFAEYRDLYPYFLIPALAGLVLLILLSHTRFLRVP